MAAAPGLKMPPVGAAGAAAVLGLGCLDEAAGLLGQTVQGGGFPALERGDDQIVGHGAINCSGFLAPDKPPITLFQRLTEMTCPQPESS